MKNFKSIRKLIYYLKRNWPTEVQIVRTTVETDMDSGVKDVTVVADLTVRKAVLLPSRMITDFVYDLSYVAANKNFSYGGFFDKDVRNLIIDAEDLRGFTINLHDTITIGNRPSACENIGYFEGSNGTAIAYLISIKDTVSVPNV